MIDFKTGDEPERGMCLWGFEIVDFMLKKAGIGNVTAYESCPVPVVLPTTEVFTSYIEKLPFKLRVRPQLII